jgi:HlyD family secretion protein
MTRPTRWHWYLLGGFFLVAGFGWARYVHSQGHSDYQFSTVERGDIQSVITATGTSNAVVTVQVGSQVSGNIKALNADFNTKVTKGQVIAVIDPEMFQARLNQSRANLDSAKAAVVSARAQVQKVAADVASAQANLQNEFANLAKAKVAVLDGKLKLDRRVLLFKEGVAAREDQDTAQAVYDSAIASQNAAESQCEAAKQGILAAQAQREVAQTQLASAEAQVRQVEAAVRQAEVDVEHTVIRAPVDGTVIARRMDVGQTVAASFQAPTIFEIAQDLTRMQVDASVDEADIGRIRVGQPAIFTVDAHPGQIFRARVSQLRQAPINVQNVITYDVVITVDNSDLKLLPGMTASVKILTDQAKGVLKVPNLALRFRPPDAAGAPAKAASSGPRKGDPSRAPAVYVLDANGKPSPVRIRAGLTDGNFTAVESAELKEGDRVITGSAARTQSASAAAPSGMGGRGPRF